MGKMLVAAVAVSVGAMLYAAPAAAAPPPPGCERVPILGLNPQIRKICDTPLRPDGSWERVRQFTAPQLVRSTCGEFGVMTRTGYVCPSWAPKDSVPAWEGPVESYIVTRDTIPPGEPGHLCPVGC